MIRETLIFEFETGNWIVSDVVHRGNKIYK